MLLQFCDKCGKPLSEGCLARGEAVERNGELICSNCNAASVPTGGTGPLGHYETAVWRCADCGIPVTALDLIEGRAARVGDKVNCTRCKPAAAAPPRPSPSKRTAPPVPRPNSTPRHSRAAAESYVTQARHEQRRPVLPIVLFAIVFAGFAASLFFAITSQRKLDQAMNSQAREEAPDPRDSRPRERLEPEAAVRGATPADDRTGTRQPEPRDPPPAADDQDPPERTMPDSVPVPAGVMDDLVEIERGLAAPVNEMLASSDLGEVLEGLIIAGSRRLIASRGHVRALLSESDDQIRAAACRVTAMLNDAEALPALTRMAERDPNEAVKIEARKAKDRMTGQATREVRDLTDEEIEDMLADLKRELERRRGRDE